MKEKEIIEEELDLPGEEDENVGKGELPKKKKRKKSKEERMRDRRVVFWTMMVMILVSVGFWIASMLGGNNKPVERKETKNETETKRWKDYAEYEL